MAKPHFSHTVQSYEQTDVYTPQKELELQKPTHASHADVDLESGLAPLSLVSSASSTQQHHTSTPAGRQATRNVSSSHLLSPSSEKLPGLAITITQANDAAWPTREQLLQEKRAVSKGKCSGLSGRVKSIKLGLSKKQKLWMKILLALLIVGLAVGLGLGISKKVGGGVWGEKGGNMAIGGRS